MSQKISTQIIALIFIFIFSSVQFLLILRHKSPYISDSYMYKHIFYELQGFSFDDARRKIIDQIDFSKQDQVVTNIFLNERVYNDAYGFFIKRPLYPLLAFLIYFPTQNEYLSLLFPQFLSYLGLIFLAYYFFKQKLKGFFVVFSTSLFVAFYPFLDWSTYFLTDTLGALFWFLQLYFIFKFLTMNDSKWLYFFLFTLVISLLNREQSVLMLPFLAITAFLFKVYKFKNLKNNFSSTILITFLGVVTFLLISTLTKQKNILDTIIYTMNSYGFYNNAYSASEILNFMLNAIIKAHIGFAKDLVSRHWWFVFFFLGSIKIFYTFIISKKPTLIDIIMLSSAVASYLVIFLYPVLSYRFFFPVVISVIYFATFFISDFFQLSRAYNVKFPIVR